MKLEISVGNDGNRKPVGIYETIGDMPKVLSPYENSPSMTYEQLKKALISSEEEIVENLAGTRFIGMVGIPEKVIMSLFNMNMDTNNGTEYNITVHK